MANLRCDKLSLTVDGRKILRNLSFSLKPGELVVMLGPNGAGKTMAVRSALGFIKNTSGNTFLEGINIHDISPLVRAQKISYLPQIRPLAWPNRVQDIVALGRFAYGAKMGRLSSRNRDAVEHAMEACDIGHLKDREADRLSGGELARMHCARAFAAQTPLLVADEPIAALDPRHQFSIMNLLKHFVQTGGGALVILHDINLAARYADRLLWLKDGEIKANGSPEATITAERLMEIYGVKAKIQGKEIYFMD